MERCIITTEFQIPKLNRPLPDDDLFVLSDIHGAIRYEKDRIPINIFLKTQSSKSTQRNCSSIS